jgi:aryl-alcohol dehydrogenase-like predicted oxidoreductase
MEISVNTRRLGKEGPVVPPFVLGTMARGKQSKQTRIGVLRAALDVGLSVLDTAPLYDFGGTESLIGEALAGVPRDSFQIFTKVGLRWERDARGDLQFETRRPDGALIQVRRDSRPEAIRREVEQSLERLRLDHVDLVQIHQPDRLTPIAETISALLDLRGEGKLLHIGVSNFSLEELLATQRALGEVPLVSLQSEYNLLRRQLEDELLPECARRNVGVLAYSPLAGGLLGHAGHGPMGTKLTSAAIEVLNPMAASYGVSPVALVLAWLNARPGVTATVTGASSIDQLREQVTVQDVTLSEADGERLSRAFAAVGSPRTWADDESITSRVKRRSRRSVGKLLRAVGFRRKQLSPRW